MVDTFLANVEIDEQVYPQAPCYSAANTHIKLIAYVRSYGQLSQAARHPLLPPSPLQPLIG